MHRTICLIGLVLALNLVGQKCQGKRVLDRTGFNYLMDVGIAVTKPDSSCLEIHNPNLRIGQRLTFVAPTKPQSTGEIEITQKLNRGCGNQKQDPIENGEMHNGTVAHYEFKTVRGTLPKSVPVLALADFNGDIAAQPDGIRADLNHDGRVESFRSCTSSEGVHLTIWTGKRSKERADGTVTMRSPMTWMPIARKPTPDSR